MSKSERLKAEIGFHEKLFFSSMALIMALIGWGASNYQTVSEWILLGAALGLLFSIGFGVWNYRQIQKLLEALEDAK